MLLEAGKIISRTILPPDSVIYRFKKEMKERLRRQKAAQTRKSPEPVQAPSDLPAPRLASRSKRTAKRKIVESPEPESQPESAKRSRLDQPATPSKSKTPARSPKVATPTRPVRKGSAKSPKKPLVTEKLPATRATSAKARGKQRASTDETETQEESVELVPPSPPLGRGRRQRKPSHVPEASTSAQQESVTETEASSSARTHISTTQSSAAPDAPPSSVMQVDPPPNLPVPTIASQRPRQSQDDAPPAVKPVAPSRRPRMVDPSANPAVQAMQYLQDRMSSISQVERAFASTSSAIDAPGLPVIGAIETQIRQALKSTITLGEGNCLLLLGERGAGKSTVVERSLQLMQEEHGEEAFITVRLSGLVQANDRLAHQEMASQLCTHAEGLEDITASNEAILSSILGLLEPGQKAVTSQQSRPLVLVLDEFDLFATQVGRQSFLYCLLDIVQSNRRGGGMLVLGLSSRVDCLNKLEKRVKSRCQSRVLYVKPIKAKEHIDALVTTYLGYDAIHPPDDSAVAAILDDWQTALPAFLHDKKRSAHLAELFRKPQATQRLINIMRHALVRAVALLADSTNCTPSFVVATLQAALSDQINKQSTVTAVSYCTVTELAVLVACKHLSSELTDTFNLAIAYEQYLDHMRRAADRDRPYSFQIFGKAFESLYDREVIMDASATSRKNIKTNEAMACSITSTRGRFRMCRLVVWPEEIDAALRATGASLPEHLHRWSKNWSN
ncbi:uncharacterized protein L969DRAFT_43449 [Mixia osmundae IAM 14324]|uniref:Uncharacterized protein n=1 Tax=Mixia osmundae (strain CBS 9802 / IAM 14324 / JCM 22182 / KY 12970) TaxID=764103 RepID=G7EAI8_MIXOS|nr:uncharacterized protein L969DRAFT_43449 [Mixia osmundae IAM 14324]KEI42338.1 hypothetical protein L969DRAFT_43449 [Mixia osmundae IAM 14324]GAA99848.1 hypothetical protein E5Q_06551 [Mixia osmundae IAM 14324]